MRLFGYNKKKLIGKSIIVGLTFLNDDHKRIGKYQTHGVIKEITADGLISIVREDMETFQIPYDKNAIQKAEKGEYVEKETEKTIVNPDYLSVWEIIVSDESVIDEYKKHGFPSP